MDLRSTLNLPDAEFSIPMKANLPALEPQIQAKWDSDSIYHQLQKARADAPSFVLHDGPPYTNSPIHIGTALNKILKDFVVKSRTMMGYRAPYVPGFDNHGLPIEQSVIRKFVDRIKAEAKVEPSATAKRLGLEAPVSEGSVANCLRSPQNLGEFRRACREHAREYLDVQTAQFKRLGIFGLWEKPYSTMQFRFEAEIIRIFRRMAEGGYVYRGLRPTLWSPTSRTALADTEIVYQDHVSTSIYVRFPLQEDPNKVLKDYENVHAVIWTTTPWTIPANLAVAFHPDLVYALVEVPPAHGLEKKPTTYIVYGGLVEHVAQKLGWTDYKVLGLVDGVNFDHMVFKHPIFDRTSLGVLADYVTTEDGTGLVHTAPGHGRDDFFTGMRYKLPILCPVDERGVLTWEAGEFEGVYYKDCDKVVVERLKELGNLLHSENFTHSYPHAERDGQPVIFRATEQWFVAIDHNGLRARMLEEINPIPIERFVESEVRPGSHKHKGVSWVPAAGYNRISSMVAGRPDWCISRQRPWGVGIPVFYGKESRKPVLDGVAIEAVARLVEKEGSDAWFEKDADEILPQGYAHPDTGETEFTKETDVLDVWFDSGSTSLCVLEGNVEPEWKEVWPADVYLEGSDQHRGWFNSSLVIGTAINGAPPYRQVVTHGFVTDSQGRKMSKRLGNVVDPVEASDKYGADVVRYWVASVDYANDVPCSDELLKQVGEHYRTVRNTLRFLLGNLSDFDPSAPKPMILDLDEWVIEQVDLLVADCVDAYRRYDYGQLITSVHHLCVNELSRFYLDSIKDRMYCDGKDWPTRRSGQWACHYALVKLTKLLAPVIVHTAEETWSRTPGVQGTVHAAIFDVPTDERLEEIEGSNLQCRFATLLEIRARVFAVFEGWKQAAGIKDSQDVIATLSEAGNDLEVLKSFTSEELATYFKMSSVELREGPSGVQFKPSEYLKCERSRLRRPDVELVAVPGADQPVPLTARDRRAIGL
ncbi:MAG: isoleucyl-tRNA synthetase [Fimbriimonadaceae bacterium]|nr:isoleucyl-tRNA synthetase [Fimbriimonadaceae bacterium]